MSPSRPNISVVVPCYNEQDSIDNCVDQIETAFRGKEVAHEILLVNDGSTDSTLQRAHSLSKSNPSVRVIDLVENFGKATALREGVRRAEGEVIALFDADLQYSATDLIAMISLLGDGVDFVNGSRDYNGYGASRTAFSRVYNFVMRALFRTNLRDANCGIKVLKRTATDKGSIFDFGLPLVVPLLKVRGFESMEYPVMLHERKNGESKYFKNGSFLGGWNNIRDISFHTGLLLGLLAFAPLEQVKRKPRLESGN